MNGQEEDRVLIARIAIGDKLAMRRLYERHHDALIGFIRARSGDEALAADVVQDAMLDVWRGAGTYKAKASVKTWIFTIARNKMVDRLRRGAKLHFTDDVPETVDDAPDPEAVIAAAQEASRLRACLKTLKEAQRSIVQLAFFDGLTYGEIAEIEGIPSGTVKTRIFHAKQSLMRCLGRR